MLRYQRKYSFPLNPKWGYLNKYMSVSIFADVIVRSRIVPFRKINKTTNILKVYLIKTSIKMKHYRTIDIHSADVSIHRLCFHSKQRAGETIAGSAVIKYEAIYKRALQYLFAVQGQIQRQIPAVRDYAGHSDVRHNLDTLQYPFMSVLLHTFCTLFCVF